MTHTPTPYTWHESYHDNDITQHRFYYVHISPSECAAHPKMKYMDGTFKMVLFPHTQDKELHEQNKANAAFIVKACNEYQAMRESHDRLLFQLKKANELLLVKDDGYKDSGFYFVNEETITEAEKLQEGR